MLIHKNMLDLTGQTFGRLTALEPTEERRARSVVWRCRCSCGKEVMVPAHSLTIDNTKSCGCLGSGKKREKLEGRRFGSLTVTRYVRRTEKSGLIYEVRCECGVVCQAYARSLKRGMKSCGCQSLTKGRKKKNLKE